MTLALGDVDAMLPKLALGADAFYLHGFSPSRNADMWSPNRLPGSVAARPTRRRARYVSPAAGFVRRGLQAVGFEVTKAPGFGGKRDMSRGALRAGLEEPATTPRHPPQSGGKACDRHWRRLAGCAVTERLAARGWRVTLFDAHDGPARQTSSHRAAAMPAHVSSDGQLSRLSRAGNLHALRAWSALAAAGHPVNWHGCGVLQIEEGDADNAAQQAALAALGFPESFVRWMDPAEAAARHGATVARGGLWFPRGGWVAPPEICRAQLGKAGAALDARFNCRVGRHRTCGWGLAGEGGRWQRAGCGAGPGAGQCP